MVSDALSSYVDSLVIDSNMEFTPYRVINANKVVYTDHYSLLVKFKDLPVMRGSCRNASKQASRWNTNREGGWQTCLMAQII